VVCDRTDVDVEGSVVEGADTDTDDDANEFCNEAAPEAAPKA
jgi:hypothetical protein